MGKVEVETNVAFDVSGGTDSSDPDVALVLTFYKRKLGPDVHFALSQHAAFHLIKYVRETLAEREALGPSAEAILPPHPARDELEELERQLSASKDWDELENAKKDQLDAQTRKLILKVFDRLTTPEQARLLQELTEQMPRNESL